MPRNQPSSSRRVFLGNVATAAALPCLQSGSAGAGQPPAGRADPPRDLTPTGADLTSVVLTAHRNQPGALFSLLQPFAQAKLDLTRIESRPSSLGKWAYVFFIDIDGHAEDPPVANALAELSRSAKLFRVLGSYPRAVLTEDQSGPGGAGRQG